jgi:hypothetical protein
MTRGTPDTFLYVNAVIEVGVVWQVVYPDPLDGFVFPQAGADWFEISALSPDLLVTTHAGFSCRQARSRRGFNSSVTVAAVKTVIADMVLMTKLDRLLSLDPLSGVP